VILYRSGDLFSDQNVQALAHGCNCAGAMGRGIAVEFRKRWPSMYEEYRRACRLGALQPGGIFPWQHDGLWIYNLGTQRHWRTKATAEAVRESVAAMAEHAEVHGVDRIAMPRIASGLGGMAWGTVQSILSDCLQERDLLVTVYTPGESRE
jgi:O-acetyl-ADP-ribose deacetylase (regulator of RNase III)